MKKPKHTPIPERPEGFDDPKSDHFMEGASFEHRVAVLKTLAPAAYRGLEVVLLEALRVHFAAIGPHPRKAREGVLP